MMERDSGDVPIIDPDPGHGEDETRVLRTKQVVVSRSKGMIPTARD